MNERYFVFCSFGVSMIVDLQKCNNVGLFVFGANIMWRSNAG